MPNWHLTQFKGDKLATTNSAGERVELEAVGGWTIETLKEYYDAQERARTRFEDERDRRYTEVNIEKEKALKIKETADLAALSLARESQTYKEQQNDALRDKNLAQSGIYATNQDVAKLFDDFNTKLQPVFEFVVAQQGQTNGTSSLFTRSGIIFASLAAIGAVMYYIAKLGG